MIEKQYNYFYKITNLINDKFYYGIHSTNNLDDKYMGSGSAIRKAISKYGADNFKKEIIKYFDTFQEACDYEKEIVNKELLKNPDCYNLVEGGYYLSDEIIAKKKEAFNRINHQSKENNSNYNKKWIKKNNECIAVDKGDLDEYLNDGRKHVGISNVKYRLDVLCGGSIDIKSEINKGTIVTIRIPKEK